MALDRRVLIRVSTTDLATTLFGQPMAMPVMRKSVRKQAAADEVARL